MPGRPVDDHVLAIDVGASSIKLCEVRSDGELAGEVSRLETPYPCEPRRLVDVVVCEILARDCSRVGVGFPGEFRDGLVVEPGNLARPAGFTSQVNEQLDDAWRGFDLEGSLRRASGRDVRVVNDATLAALGCAKGAGREIVITLGTGFGIALVVDGSLVRIRDVGAEVLADGRTYDELLGEHSRAGDAEQWSELLRRAVAGFVQEFAASTVHLGGGNARRVDLAWLADVGATVVLNDNDASLRGAARLFDG
jgi:polyphosphate glucokinase